MYEVFTKLSKHTEKKLSSSFHTHLWTPSVALYLFWKVTGKHDKKHPLYPLWHKYGASLSGSCSQCYSKCDKRLCNEWKSESLAQELVYLRASKHRHCMNFAWTTISVLLAPPYNVCPHTQLHTHPLCYALVTLRKTVVVDHSTTQVIMTVCNQLLIWMPFERLVWSRGPGLRSLAGSCCLQSGFGLSR